MLTFFNKRLRNRKGFTLIELIVVIAIIGILAAIAVPRLGAFTTQAENQEREANTRIVESAVQMYIAENGQPAADVVADLSPYFDATDASALKIYDPADGTTEATVDVSTDITVSPDGSWGI